LEERQGNSKRIRDSRKFCKRLDDVRRPFEAHEEEEEGMEDMCRANNDELMKLNDQMLSM
jgi:hypothetical protein